MTKLGRRITTVQYWGGRPQMPNSKWRRILHIVQRCAERGWRNYLVLSELPMGSALSVPFLDVGCRIVVRPRARGSFDRRSIADTYDFLQRVRCDIFHCRNVHTSPLIGAALAGVPVRLWSKLAMSSHYERGVRPRGYHRFAPSVRVSCWLADRVLALSKAVASELLELGVAASKVTVVPVPVYVPEAGEGATTRFRHSLGLSPRKRLITSVGHAVPVKGWDVLIDAFGMVAEAVPDVELALVGSVDAPDEAPFHKDLCTKVVEYGLNGKVHFLGQRSDISEILAATDVFAFPSRSDGQGLALTEALTVGLPCVAAATGGIPELIDHGQSGLLFPREDAKTLANHLCVVLRDRALRDRLKEGAKAEGDRFRMETYEERVLSQYDSLLRTRFS